MGWGNVSVDLVGVLAFIGAVVKFVVFPQLERVVSRIVHDAVSPLSDKLDEVHLTVQRELQPNGIPLATKVAVIKQQLEGRD